MALLVSDQMVQEAQGGQNEIVRYDEYLITIGRGGQQLFPLAKQMAESVERHGYDKHSSIVACIDECLLASFAHCENFFDLDRELELVPREDPEVDKFPDWLPVLPPKKKCAVGKHMAKNDIDWDWAESVSLGLTPCAKVQFRSPDGQRQSRVLINHQIGPFRDEYATLYEEYAEMLEFKRQNQERQRRNSLRRSPHPMSNAGFKGESLNNASDQHPGNPMPVQPSSSFPPVPGRLCMAGIGRFVSAVRHAEWLDGEHPYAYAFDNPVTYTDPSDLDPCSTAAVGWASSGGGIKENRLSKFRRCQHDLENQEDSLRNSQGCKPRCPGGRR